MSARDQFLMFLEMCFTIFIITVAIKFFTVGDRILVFASLLKGASPVIILVGVAYLKLRYNQYQQKRYRLQTGRSSEEYTLYLNFYHKMITDLVLFVIPITILLVALFSKAELDKEDIIQASLAFIIFYYWQNLLFRKREP